MRRPITFAPSSTCSIDSTGTRRRRRASQPERTLSASGVSGEVPYIGHSTVPTTRPRASATRKPAVRRRSIARALIALNLFPVCEETPPVAVKLLLAVVRGLRAPFAGHREPRDAEQHEINEGEHGDDTAGHRFVRAIPPEGDAGRDQQDEQAEVADEVADAEPGRVVVPAPAF